MGSPIEKLLKQLKRDAYQDHTRHYQREVGTDFPDDSTELLNELGTTDESIGEPKYEYESTTMGPIPSNEHDLDETTLADMGTTWPNDGTENSSSGSSQTMLIILGLLLGILVLVCCVLACILARIRRRGFCTMDGRNEAMCDDDCQGDELSSQPSQKDSMASTTVAKSRSSDKLLEQ